LQSQRMCATGPNLETPLRCSADLGGRFLGLRPTAARQLPGSRQAAAHARQDKELVLEFEGLSGFLSTKDEGIFVFDEPL